MTPARIGFVAVLALLVLGSGWFAWQKLRSPLTVGPTAERFGWAVPSI